MNKDVEQFEKRQGCYSLDTCRGSVGVLNKDVEYGDHKEDSWMKENMQSAGVTEWDDGAQGEIKGGVQKKGGL